MSQPSNRDPSDAGGSATDRAAERRRHAGKIPEQPRDSTAAGDAHSGVGEDNHGAKPGEQSAEDFIRR
jgi:hypothetical protein